MRHANLYKPHIVIIPEDKANTDLATDFLVNLDEGVNVQILAEAGGWRHVIQTFCEEEQPRLAKYVDRLVILLLDFDESITRLADVKASIRGDFADRVFVLGSWNTPQTLKAELGKSSQAIGRVLERECREGIRDVWAHPALSHNEAELRRFRQKGMAILYLQPKA